jgi:hypothetical protein
MTISNVLKNNMNFVLLSLFLNFYYNHLLSGFTIARCAIVRLYLHLQFNIMKLNTAIPWHDEDAVTFLINHGTPKPEISSMTDIIV